MRKEYLKPELHEEYILEGSCLLAGSGNTEIVNLEENDGDFDSDETTTSSSMPKNRIVLFGMKSGKALPSQLSHFCGRK